MNKYDVILFDLDGTVLDTLVDLHHSVNYALETFDLPLRTEAEVRSFLGNGIRRLIRRSVPVGVDEELTAQVFCCFREYYMQHCQEKTRPYPGIISVLRKIKAADIVVGMVSNKNDEAVQALASAFFPEVFDVVVGQNEERRPKPAPDMIEFALRHFDVESEQCLYVGDSEVDKATADCAGMDCALVTWGFRDVEFLEELNAKVMISHPEMLLLFLGL